MTRSLTVASNKAAGLKTCTVVVYNKLDDSLANEKDVDFAQVEFIEVW